MLLSPIASYYPHALALIRLIHSVSFPNVIILTNGIVLAPFFKHANIPSLSCLSPLPFACALSLQIL